MTNICIFNELTSNKNCKIPFRNGEISSSSTLGLFDKETENLAAKFNEFSTSGLVSGWVKEILRQWIKSAIKSSNFTCTKSKYNNF